MVHSTRGLTASALGLLALRHHSVALERTIESSNLLPLQPSSEEGSLLSRRSGCTLPRTQQQQMGIVPPEVLAGGELAVGRWYIRPAAQQ